MLRPIFNVLKYINYFLKSEIPLNVDGNKLGFFWIALEKQMQWITNWVSLTQMSKKTQTVQTQNSKIQILSFP